MNFDLNIDNYTRDELIQMFELPSNFDRNIVEIKEEVKVEPEVQEVDPNDFRAMIEAGRNASEDDEDCIMCSG